MLDEFDFESDFEDLLESAEDDESWSEDDESWDEDDEASERRRRLLRRRGRGRLKTPPRGNAVAKRPAAGYATKAELAATAKRLDGRIATNSTAIKALDGRTRTMETNSAKMGTALRKEIAMRKKTVGALKKSLDETRQISMIMPLLSSPGSVTISGTTHKLDEGDSFSKMLPILLLSGSGSSGSGGGGMFGGENSGMMMVMMMMALGK